MSSLPPEGPEEALPETLPENVVFEDAEGSQLPVKIGHILEKLPPEDRQQAQIILQQMVAQYSGPVPHASEMARYKEVDPSFPERFVVMAEKQVAHRHALEAKVMGQEFQVRRRGQDYAMAATVLGLLFGVVFIWMGSPIVAGIVSGTTVVGVVTAFVAGRVIESKGSSEGDDKAT